MSRIKVQPKVDFFIHFGCTSVTILWYESQPKQGIFSRFGYGSSYDN